jgi:hypothetical protein
MVVIRAMEMKMMVGIIKEIGDVGGFGSFRHD